MKYIIPDYYQEFRCIANQCPDTCCAGWEITIDQQSMNRYQQLKGPFGNRLHNSIDLKHHTFLQYDHKCIFLNEENLCDMYSEAGPDMLCQTCKQYPRHSEAYLNVRELSIAISCPEVARMILTSKQKVQFLTKDIAKPIEQDVVFQAELFRQLNEARNVMFELLQNRSLDITIRIRLVLGFAHDLQKRIDLRDYYNMSRLIQHYEKDSTINHLVEKLQNSTYQKNQRYKIMQDMLKELTHLEVLQSEWPAFVKNAGKTLEHLGKRQYERRFSAFHKCNPCLPIQMEQLMIYFIYGYTNGAVYDSEFYTKVKFAVMNTLMLEEFFFATWITNGNQLSLNQQIEIAYHFAREIEHLDDNIEYCDHMLRKKKEFNLIHMFGCLDV